MVSDDIVMYLVIVEGEIIKVYFFFDIFLLGSYIKKILYICLFCIDVYIWKEKRKDYLFLFIVLIEKSGKNCDKGELYKIIVEKYKVCMRDMVGRVLGIVMG